MWVYNSERLTRPIAIALGFLVLGFVVYSGVVSSFFVSDDFVMLQRLRAAPFRVWSNVADYSFFPLMYLVLMAEGHLWGLAAAGYHVVSIVLHVANALTVCLISALLTKTYGGKSGGWTVAAVAAGLWFLVSPSHTEAVSWIAARHHVLATFFGLLSLAAYMAYGMSKRRVLLVLSLALFAAALLSKESVVTLPLMVLLHDALASRFGRSNKRRRAFSLSGFLWFVAVAVTYLALRQWYFGGLTAGLTASGSDPAGVSELLGNLLRQFSRALLPPLAGRGTTVVVSGILGALLALVAARAVIRRQMHDGRSVTAALLFLFPAYLLATLPYLPFHVATIDSQGERFLYWPGAFLTMGAVCALYGVLGDGRRLRLLMAGIVLVSAVALYQRNRNWSVAATVTRQVIADACTLAEGQDTLIVANLADNVNGAYVLRNGLWHALQLFCPQNGLGADVVALSTHGIAGAAEPANVRALGGGAYDIAVARSFVQRPLIPRSLVGSLSITGSSENSYRLNVSRLPDRSRLVFYSAGRLQAAP